MFHDLRDWMLTLQLSGVREVDFSITRKTKKIGLGRVLHGKRILDLARRAASDAMMMLDDDITACVSSPRARSWRSCRPLTHAPQTLPREADDRGP